MFNPLSGLINAILGIIEFLLSLRFLFKFFGIGGLSFNSWLLNITQSLINPFVGILPSFSLGPFFLETSCIIAIIVFGLIGYFIAAIFSGPHHHHDY